MKKKNILYSDHFNSDEIYKFDPGKPELAKYVPLIKEIEKDYDFDYAYFSTLMKYIWICEHSDPNDSDNDRWKILQIEEVVESNNSSTITLDNFDEEEKFENKLKIIKIIDSNYETLIRNLVESIRKNMNEVKDLLREKKSVFS
jgi:hypothetical protein